MLRFRASHQRRTSPSDRKTMIVLQGNPMSAGANASRSAGAERVGAVPCSAK